MACDLRNGCRPVERQLFDLRNSRGFEHHYNNKPNNFVVPVLALAQVVVGDPSVLVGSATVLTPSLSSCYYCPQVMRNKIQINLLALPLPLTWGREV